jgi:hypothetical protein
MRRLSLSVFFPAVLGMLVVTGESRAAMLSPIETSGHDADIVFENDGSPAQNEEIGSRWYFEQGLFGNQVGEQGLPTSRNITGFVSPITTNTIDFKFDDYGANNALDFDGAATVGPKILTLDVPASYSQLAVVFSGGSLTGFATLAYTINYAGGGTQIGSIEVPDWSATSIGTANARMLAVDRSNQSAGVPTFDNTATAVRWSVFETEITPNSSANILSVDFTASVPDQASGDDVDVFGLSGMKVPEPGLIALISLGLAIASRMAARKRSFCCDSRTGDS